MKKRKATEEERKGEGEQRRGKEGTAEGEERSRKDKRENESRVSQNVLQKIYSYKTMLRT